MFALFLLEIVFSICIKRGLTRKKVLAFTAVVITASATATAKYYDKGKDTTATGRVSVARTSATAKQKDKNPNNAITVTERITTVHNLPPFKFEIFLSSYCIVRIKKTKCAKK